MRQFLIALVVTTASVAAEQKAALKIVVVDGEGAVNIIQQKTALRAVVEVRDQNNLPVPGATVTFAIASQGGASVAGAQTFTVVTNATGQAALTGATPLTSGGVQISVNATFNGLSATASISQTVVTTTAAAAGTAGSAAGAATGAGASGAAGAGGAAAAGAASAGAGAAGAAGAVGAAGAAATGGLSIGAIAGIVGGAVAVGGGVAAAGGSDSSSSGGTGSSVPDPTGGSGPAPVGRLPSCEFTVTPEDILVGNEGAAIPLTIVLKNVDPCENPNWSVDVGNAVSWISVNPTSGSRSGGAVVTIAPYTPTTSAPNRIATIIVAYEKVLISQPCRCPISGLPPVVSVRSAPRRAAGLAVRDDR